MQGCVEEILPFIFVLPTTFAAISFFSVTLYDISFPYGARIADIMFPKNISTYVRNFFKSGYYPLNNSN